MKNVIIAAAFVAASTVSAFARTSPAANSDSNTPALATPDTKNPTAPVEGADSFTEGQAKERIEKAGYTEVKKSRQGRQGRLESFRHEGRKSRIDRARLSGQRRRQVNKKTREIEDENCYRTF